MLNQKRCTQRAKNAVFDAERSIGGNEAAPREPIPRLDITEAALAAAPGFNPDAYPDTATTDWDAEIRRYWRND